MTLTAWGAEGLNIPSGDKDSMSTIIYEKRSDSGESETYEIDELSQRLLVYLLTNGSATVDAVQNPIGATSSNQIEVRYNNTLGPDAAGLVEQKETNQTLDGDVLTEYTLSESGEDFVYTNKSSLSMPADLAELAKTVSRLEVDLTEVRQRLEEIELQLEE